ncbi:MAG: putative 2OG-Fe(II) oxygenase [Pseudomonadota bacterium]
MTDAAFMSMLQRAAGRLNAGEVSIALQEIDAALRIAPNDLEALHLKAMALGRAGRIEESIETFERVAASHSRADVVLLNFGNMLKRAGRVAESRSAYERAAAAAPASADALDALGLACQQQGDLSAAKNAFASALRLQPRHPSALNNLGILEASQNSHVVAVECFTRALAAAPSMFSALINRGAALRTLGRFDEALTDQRKCALLAPRSAEPFYQEAATLRAAGRFAEASTAYLAAIERDPGRVDVQREYANMKLETGDQESAFTAFDGSIERTGLTQLIAARGETSLLSGDAAAALSFAKRALQQDARHAKSHELLARASRALGDGGEALVAARRAIEFEPDNFEFLHTCCEIEMALGAVDIAVQRLQRDAPPKHLQKHFALKAIALRATGDASYRLIYDYDRLTAQIPIEIPDGFETIEQFNAALAAAIAALHKTTSRPVDQTLYGGTQSAGRLWNEPDPVIQAYVKAMRRAAVSFVGSLPDDPNHPFLSRKSIDLDCVGAWSVMLDSGGGHVDHIHPAGWVSACYYVSAPDEVLAGERAGFLRVGASGVAGLTLPAERYFPPTPGTVVFFPSYMWHGVEPFSARTKRITAPFDLAPRS